MLWYFGAENFQTCLEPLFTTVASLSYEKFKDGRGNIPRCLFRDIVPGLHAVAIDLNSFCSHCTPLLKGIKTLLNNTILAP